MSDENDFELCFDLPQFKSENYSVSDFVHSLVHLQDYANLLSYEETLKYATFPALDLKTDDREIFGENTQYEHREIFKTLDWLKHKKKVEHIIGLIVLDRLVNPHDETKIGTYVKDFEVEILNWRLLDLSISVFDDSGCGENSALQQIRELHLYASGKLSVISHWLSEDGIRSLKNLTTLEIYVVQELSTREKCRVIARFIERRFRDLSNKINEERQKTTMTVGSSRSVSASGREIQQRKEKQTWERFETPSATSDANNAFQASSVVNLSESSDTSSVLLNGYQNEKDGEHKTLWSRVKKGQSFVDDESRVSSWLFASDPHGTQMANLICAINPCCDLYVAKVAEGRSGIIPARVERAVRWAISLDVDIISISFAILEGTEGLADACEAALYNGIIILCSTPDEGLNTDKSCISDYNGAMTITACDGFGIVSPNAPTYYDYTLNGMNVAAGKVPFLESKDCISGSSVSTAIAAGLSSLILACERLAKNRQDYKRGERSKIVKHHFGKMTATSKKYIILEKFADIDKKIKDGRYINAKEVIEGFFAQEKYKE